MEDLVDSCIYILYWDINKPYIGQTTHFSKRRLRHLNELHKGIHCNYKLQNEYTLYKTNPIIEVLQYATTDQLNYLEESYIKEFNSINSGLNIISGGYSVGAGVNNPASKYTEDQLIKVYTLLGDYKNSYEFISKQTEVPITTVKKIGQGVQHVWLQEMFPVINEYIKIYSKQRYTHSACAASQGKQYRKIMSPTGKVYSVTNTLEFSKEHNLPNGNLCSVLLGKRRSVQGWIGIDD